MKHFVEKILVNTLPPMIYRFIGAIYGFIIAPKKSYSQYGEDLIIESFFRQLPTVTRTYVDIGAFHPRWLSNTYRLSKSGWRGAAVDIDAHKIKLFELIRKDCLGFIGAVAPGNFSSKMTVHRFRRLWSEIDTLSLEDAKKYEKNFNIKFDSSEIKTLSINEVLKGTTEIYGRVNFVNIDIEGLDEAILFDLDFSMYNPELICFENNLHFSGSPELKSHLHQKGYEHLFSSGGTHGYFKFSSLKA